MRKMILATTALLAAGGFAAAASADEATRYHTVSGRQVVWHTQGEVEKPYALRGEERRAAETRRGEEPGLEFRHQGRSGTSVERNPGDDARE